jgi:hypothetical protein
MLTFEKEVQHRCSCEYETLARLWEDVRFVQIEHRACCSSRLKDLEITSDVRASQNLVVEKGVPGSTLPDGSA